VAEEFLRREDVITNFQQLHASTTNPSAAVAYVTTRMSGFWVIDDSVRHNRIDPHLRITKKPLNVFVNALGFLRNSSTATRFLECKQRGQLQIPHNNDLRRNTDDFSMPEKKNIAGIAIRHIELRGDDRQCARR